MYCALCKNEISCHFIELFVANILPSILHILRSSTTLTEVFPCFFLSCKANARVKLAKTGHGPHSSKLLVICVVLLLFVLFHVLFVCKCVLYHCHWVLTQLQLTNISYHILCITCRWPVMQKHVIMNTEF